MAEFLRTTGISMQLEEIICYAKKNLYLVSPYLQIYRNLYDRIARLDPNVVITVLYEKKQFEQERGRFTLSAG